MSSLVSPDNSFIQFYNTPPPEDTCGHIIPYCLPVNSWEDLYTQFITEGLTNCPTVVMHLNIDGTPVTELEAMSCLQISGIAHGGTNYWLVVDSNCCDLELLLARFKTLYSSYGTWTIDPISHTLKCTGDIHAFAEAVDGVVYHVHCTCYMHFTSMSPNMTVLLEYMSTNYPSYGPWILDPDHANSLMAIGDICDFAAMIPDVTYEIVTSTHCEVVVTSYDCTDQDVVDFLNEGDFGVGTWSISGGKIVSDGDISDFAGTIPCVEYHIDNDGPITYTNLLYGRLGTDDNPISHYLEEGDCFTITATLDGTVYESNCFQYTEDICYTRRIKYRSNQNVFGFTYYLDADNNGENDIPDFYNTVRLQLYTRHPLPTSTETGYRKSNGDYMLLSSVMELAWECVTNWTDADWHRKMFIALGNNDFQIFSDTLDVWKQYRKEGDYVPAWDKSPALNLNSAPATVQLKESPFHNFNSNCK